MQLIRSALRAAQSRFRVRADIPNISARPAFDPPAASLRQPPPVDRFFREDAVLEYIAHQGFEVDADTGLLGENHWSEHWQFRALARKVKIRLTTRWPNPDSFREVAYSDFCGEIVRWGLTGDGRLRIRCNAEFRKRLLDNEQRFDSPHLIGVLLHPKFPSLQFQEDGRVLANDIEHGVSTWFWNPEGLLPCRELLREGYFDYHLFEGE